MASSDLRDTLALLRRLARGLPDTVKEPGDKRIPQRVAEAKLEVGSCHAAMLPEVVHDHNTVLAAPSQSLNAWDDLRGPDGASAVVAWFHWLAAHPKLKSHPNVLLFMEPKCESYARRLQALGAVDRPESISVSPGHKTTGSTSPNQSPSKLAPVFRPGQTNLAPPALAVVGGRGQRIRSPVRRSNYVLDDPWSNNKSLESLKDDQAALLDTSKSKSSKKRPADESDSDTEEEDSSEEEVVAQKKKGKAPAASKGKAVVPTKGKKPPAKKARTSFKSKLNKKDIMASTSHLALDYEAASDDVQLSSFLCCILLSLPYFHYLKDMLIPGDGSPVSKRHKKIARPAPRQRSDSYDYFLPRQLVKPARKGEESTHYSFQCKFCQSVKLFLKSSDSFNSPQPFSDVLKFQILGFDASRLKHHRDGYRKAGPCKKRASALKEMELPQTWAQLNKVKATDVAAVKDSALYKSMNAKTFSPETLNGLLAVWTLKTAKPFVVTEEADLRAAFNYANPRSALISDTTNRKLADGLYSELREVASEQLEAASSFASYPDVWTTFKRGSGFLGSRYTTIKDWKLCVRQLCMKHVAGRHFGELLAIPLFKSDPLLYMLHMCTDRGSNNFPFARKIARKLSVAARATLPQDTPIPHGIVFDDKHDHGTCYCHEIGRSVAAGSAVPGIHIARLRPKLPPPPVFLLNGEALPDVEADSVDSASKRSTQRECDLEDDEPSDWEGEEDGFEDSDAGEGGGEEESDESEVEEEPKKKGKKAVITSAVGRARWRLLRYIRRTYNDPARKEIHRATHAQLAEKDSSLQLGGLLPSVGIRWHNDRQVLKRGVQHIKVILAVLAQDSERFYKSCEVSFDDAECISCWTKVLDKIMAVSSRRMEQHRPTLAELLYEYFIVEEELVAIQATEEVQRYPEMVAAIDAMLVKHRQFKNSASRKLNVLKASVFHPSHKLNLIESLYPEQYAATRKSLIDEYEYRKATKAGATGSAPPLPSSSVAPALGALKYRRSIVLSSPTGTTPQLSSLERYFNDPDEPVITRGNECLDWWKQLKQHQYDSVVLEMVNKYLGFLASSAPSEQLFSRAADVCTTKRPGLDTTTIERCINTGEWLREGLRPKVGKGWDDVFAVRELFTTMEATKAAKGASIVID
ncbi:hypothetical protein P7C70_g6759, partial [Phenoliferia sp. Uapishka_3]